VDAADLSLPRDGGPVLPVAESAWLRAVRDTRAGRSLPALSIAAADRVVALVPPGAVGARRDLALGRLARALAGLAGQAEASPGQVDSAAELIGLPGRRPGPQLPPEPVGEGAAALSEYAPSGDPYPEDDAVPQRDADPLRIGWRLTGPQRGYPIGTKRALDATDIAVTATLFEAARQQKMRDPEGLQRGRPLHVLAQDLRSYRRAAKSSSLLVLLLDHTCRTPDWDWYAQLAPYLRWAYVNRTAVGVVEVGAADPDDGELRATQFRCRNLLDPRLPAALERPPGRATPLAHGLDLAAAMLRHDTQQGSTAVDEATLVVVTDGRGNVPLAASQLGTPPEFAGRSGVRDALDAARAIRALHRVRSVVIHPGLELHGHLAAMLAEALGARLAHDISAEAVSVPGAAVPGSGAA
jgi:magnesium chelatase subunit D